MQDDLIAAYCKASGSSWSQPDAYKKAVKMPAPRYYVTPKQAYQVIAPMMKGDFERVNLMLPNRRRMYYSLYRKCLELAERREFKSLWSMMPTAVSSPAPEFFLSWTSLMRIRRWMKTGDINDEGRCVEPMLLKCYTRRKARIDEEKRLREERRKAELCEK